MKSKRDSVVFTIACLAGGFFFSVLALTALLGGYILAMLMVAAAPFVMGFLVVEAILVKRPVYVESAGTVAVAVEGARAAPPKPTAAFVTATVVAAEGVCPQAYQVKVGDTWSFNGMVQGAKVLCPTAERQLGYAVARFRAGQLNGDEIRCVGFKHRIIFALHVEGQEGHTLEQKGSQGALRGGR